MTSTQPMALRRIFIFWYPMAVTWLMMSLEGSFLAAVIARLADPKPNLAAFGVAFAVAILVEAPVIMMLSASTALVEDAASLRKLRRFTSALNAAVTAAMVLLLLTPLWSHVARDLIGLNEEVTRLSHLALLALLPWPGAIGYRRFYQGLLIRGGLTRRVAYGTVARLCSMALTGIALYALTDLPGAVVGGCALSVGVLLEALASRLMTLEIVRRTLADEDGPARELLTYARIVSFYWPLAMTSLIGLALQPIVTFFMGRAVLPLDSLAVLPVVGALTFIFRAMGLSYQEVAIAILAKDDRSVRAVTRFAVLLGAAASVAMAAMAFTPLATLWFRQVSGLSIELAAFAVAPTQIQTLLPLLSVLLSFQRAILVHGRSTGAITWATLIELAGVIAILTYLIGVTSLVGVTAAAVALMIGRLASNLSLIGPCLRVMRRTGSPA